VRYDIIKTKCDCCNSDFGGEDDKDDCFLIPLPRCAAYKTAVCAECLKVLWDAAEDLTEEGALE